MQGNSEVIVLINLIRELLLPHESDFDGVSEVLRGLGRHLDQTHKPSMQQPVLPDERSEILEQAISSITEPRLLPLANQIRLSQNQLTWRIDEGLFYGDDADLGSGFRNSNMHTELIGPNGCVFRDDNFSLGIFLLGPKVLYRDHNHAAHELYFNLIGPCGWRFNMGPWQDYQAGSIVWNPEGQIHATRTYQQPFLSVYSWTRDLNCGCQVIKADDWQEIEEQLKAL